MFPISVGNFPEMGMGDSATIRVALQSRQKEYAWGSTLPECAIRRMSPVEGSPSTRWTTTLPSNVNLPHAICCRASRGQVAPHTLGETKPSYSSLWTWTGEIMQTPEPSASTWKMAKMWLSASVHPPSRKDQFYVFHLTDSPSRRVEIDPSPR